MSERKIMIGVPCYGDWKAEMAVSLIRALPVIDEPTDLSVHRGCYVHLNRESIWRDAVEAGSTHLMFVDADMVFSADGIRRLLELDKDIAGGMYNTKSEPPVNTIKLMDADGTLLTAPSEGLPSIPFQVASLGTGFMMIKVARVLESGMQPPLFDFIKHQGRFTGEDVSFCLRAKEAGLEIWCDPRIQLGHMGDYRY